MERELHAESPYWRNALVGAGPEGVCVDFYHVPYTYVPSLAFEVHLLFGAFYGLLFAVIDRLSSLLTGSRSQVGTGDLKRP